MMKMGVGLTPEQEQKLMQREMDKGEQQLEQREINAADAMKTIMAEFKKPFPKEAHQKIAHNGFTTIKAQYITERLNNVMDMGIGLTDWVFHPNKFEKVEGAEEMVCDGTLALQVGKKSFAKHASGGGKKNKSNSWGDVRKSAQTDAMTKAASLFGIGNDVFKGLVNPDGSSKTQGSTGSTGGGFASRTKSAKTSNDDEI